MKPSGAPTLQTIADLAGVSRSTVSLALRNHPALPVSTRERIGKIADEVGYHPNRLVSALMAHIKASRPVTEMGTIAVLTNYDTPDGWRQLDSFRRIYDGATERAHRSGYRLDEFWLKEPGITARRLETILRTRGIDGVVITPFQAGHGHLSLDLTSFASVALGYSMTRPKLHRAANHHIESVRMAVRELRHRGYRRVGLAINDSHDRRVNFNWSAGYLSYQRRTPPAEQVPIHSAETLEKESFLRWVEENQPDAILCALAVVQTWLAEAGIRVPEDLGVAMLDLAETDGALAGIDQLAERTGWAAIDMIVGQLQRNERGVPESPKVTLTESRWVDGQTVRARQIAGPVDSGSLVEN